LVILWVTACTLQKEKLSSSKEEVVSETPVEEEKAEIKSEENVVLEKENTKLILTPSKKWRCSEFILSDSNKTKDITVNLPTGNGETYKVFFDTEEPMISKWTSIFVMWNIQKVEPIYMEDGEPYMVDGEVVMNKWAWQTTTLLEISSDGNVKKIITFDQKDINNNLVMLSVIDQKNRTMAWISEYGNNYTYTVLQFLDIDTQKREVFKYTADMSKEQMAVSRTLRVEGNNVDYLVDLMERDGTTPDAIVVTVDMINKQIVSKQPYNEYESK